MDTRREFLASLGVGLLGTQLVGAQAPQRTQAAAGQGVDGGRRDSAPPVRKVKTTPLFKSPEGYPNAIAVAREGLWIAEQKSDNAHLVDWNGKLLKTVKTESKNTSGMGYSEGYIWMAANAAPEGIFQTDMNSKTISHRQIPLGPGDNGGGCHGAEYVNGKLWIAALRLRGILRVDAKTWQPEFLIPYSVPRAHGVAWDNGAIWLVTGNEQGAGSSSTTPRLAGFSRPRNLPRPTRTRMDWPGTMAFCTVATPASIPAGRRTRVRRTATSSG